MITKQIAGLLYGFSYQLQDNEGNVWQVVGSEYEQLIISDKNHVDRLVQFEEIGSTYKILAREMDLTKPIEGVGVPIVELLTLMLPNSYAYPTKTKGIIDGSENIQKYILYPMADMIILKDPKGEEIYYDQKITLNWLYTHHFNLDFPEGTTTNLI